MVPKGNKIVRKIIYFLLFALLAVGFIYLGEKYKDNSLVKTYTINDYYPDADSELFEAISGSKLINILKSKDSYLVLIGSSKSDYSKKYLKEIEGIAKELNIEKIEYYDLRRDKTQKNANYYEIRKQLNGFLTTTDGSDQNLLAPSFYIIKKGKVVYYNTETVAVKNTDNVEKYWTEPKEIEFYSEISVAINKYYLNK